MVDKFPELMDAFESWLLRRVVHAVENGEVSADLLPERWAGLEAASEQTWEEGRIESCAGIPSVQEQEGGPPWQRKA